MMIHVPGLTNSGIHTTQYTEHVDLFPTLTEAAAGITLPPCPHGDRSFAVALCTEGTSLLPLMEHPTVPVKLAAFSQYPRGYQRPDPDAVVIAANAAPISEGTPTTSQCIVEGGKGCTMGYTLVTRRDGSEYRYTEWCDFNTAGHDRKVNWDRVVGVELYNHTEDPGENYNINVTKAASAEVKMLSAALSAMLHAGPTYGPDEAASNARAINA
eukprot:SAG22_NODE_273_length_13182_cov_12.693419_2_plen_213_part_00